MKGFDLDLLRFMEGVDKCFTIPVYQRNYDWTIANCKQLFDDLIKIVKNNRNSHFFGSIVHKIVPSRGTEHQIIDGQQRLTTVSLLLLALYHLLEQGKMTSTNEFLKDRIYENYLVNKYNLDGNRYKLKPIKKDSIAYQKLFGSEKDFERGSNLTVNYNYFYEQIQKGIVSVDELFDAISKLQIIHIQLEEQDDPQLIFESLNSTGLDLSEGDKIRNYILMRLPANLQEEYYERYWNKIEINTKYQVDLFMRDYLSVVQQETAPMNKIYFAFKNYVEREGIETERLLQKLLQFSKFYNVLITGNADDQRISSCIDRLNRLETSVIRPFFLEILRLHEDEILSIEDVAEIFLMTENYLFRRTICDLPTNLLNKVFLHLHKEIVRLDGTTNEYLDKFKYILLSKKEKARFPRDREFAESLVAKPVYTMKSKNKTYILERFENANTREDKNIYKHLDNGDFSIEHIMPQVLGPAWKKLLGEDYARIHEKWLHRLANLTLTAYNSFYSNNSFEDKKTMKNGFSDSGLRMNQWIAQQNQWTETEMIERNKWLQKTALEIWKAPTTDYEPAVKQLDSCTLDDDTDLTGQRIVRFEYLSMEQPVKDWADMFERVIRLLYSEDKSVLQKLAYEDDPAVDLASNISYKKPEQNRWFEIDQNIYFKRSGTTKRKMAVLRKLFTLYHRDPSELVFYLKEEAHDLLETRESKDKQSIKSFWELALPQIKEKNEENRMFSRRNPIECNVMNGFFGQGGFCLSCVANGDDSRVQLTLSKKDRQLNKDAFDRIKAHQHEIEGALGVQLIWDRGDDTRISKISYAINTGIDRKENWPMVAEFFANWTEKFYKTMIDPCLLQPGMLKMIDS